MPERASVLQATQIGVDTTPGTPVAANKRLPSLMIEPSVKAENKAFAANGYKVGTVTALGKEWSEWKISGPPTYDELSYVLTNLLVNVAPVQQAATTAYKWTFAPAASSEDTKKRWTMEHGGTVRAAKAAFGMVTDLTLDWDRSDVKLSGGLLAQSITDGITLTATPTLLAQLPILAKDLTVYADTTNGGLGTTKLTRVKKGQLKIGNRVGGVWVSDKSQASFAAEVELPISAQLKLWVEADAQGMGHLTNMRNASRQFIRLDWTSDLLAGTAIPYSLKVDVAANVSDVSDFGDDEGVYGLEWTFDVQYDTTWTNWLSLALINKLTTL